MRQVIFISELGKRQRRSVIAEHNTHNSVHYQKQCDINLNGTALHASRVCFVVVIIPFLVCIDCPFRISCHSPNNNKNIFKTIPNCYSIILSYSQNIHIIMVNLLFQPVAYTFGNCCFASLHQITISKNKNIK